MPATAQASCDTSPPPHPKHSPYSCSLCYEGPDKNAAAVQALLKANGANDDGHLVVHPSEPVVFGSRVCKDPGDAKATRYIAFNSSEQIGMLSRRHALLLFDEDERGFRVRDLKSMNGLQVNGVRVQDALLRSDDVLTFGGASKCEVGAQPSSRLIKSIWQFKVTGMPAGPQALSAHPGALDQIVESEAVLRDFELRVAGEELSIKALKATSDAEQVSVGRAVEGW